MPRKALFLVNPAAGKRQSREPLFDAAAVLSQAGYLLNIHLTSGRGDATETARREGADYDLVLCSGGDGTLNETITGLMDLPSPPPLGYLPRGSTNDFAASLGIPAQPAEAAEAIVRSQGRALDIGRWNDRCFAYGACFGAFTRTSYSAPQEATNILGHFAYILEGVKDLNSLRPYRVLGRGYAMVYDSKNKLCSADALSTGDRITLRGAAHTAECTVLSVEELNESTQKL